MAKNNNVKSCMDLLEKYKRYVKHGFTKEALDQLLDGLVLSDNGHQFQLVEKKMYGLKSQLSMVASNVMHSDNVVKIPWELSLYNHISVKKITSSERHYTKILNDRMGKGYTYVRFVYDKYGNLSHNYKVYPKTCIKLLNDIEKQLKKPVDQQMIQNATAK